MSKNRAGLIALGFTSSQASSYKFMLDRNLRFGILYDTKERNSEIRFGCKKII